MGIRGAKMKYKKAKYIKVMVCPYCLFNKGAEVESDEMPERYDFIRKNDDYGNEYIECPCGCKFIE